MNREDAAQFTSEIVSTDTEAIARRCRANGMSPPKFAWSPEPGDLDDDALKFLLQYWYGLRGGGELPEASAFKFSSAGPALSVLMVMDIVEDGWDYEYLYYGSEIQARSGFDMTGRRTSSIKTTEYISTFFIACYRAMLERRDVLYTAHKPPNTIAAAYWRRLILPMVNENGRITRIVAGNVPGKWRIPLSGKRAAWADWFDSHSRAAG